MAILAIARESVIRGLLPVITVYKQMNVHSLLAIAGMAGPLLLATTDLTTASLTPGYNLIRDSISALALTPTGWLVTIGFMFIGLLVEIFTAGLFFNIKGAWGFRFSIGLLVLFGFAMLLIGAFRADPVGAARTIEGRIHGMTATSAFWIFPVAMATIAPSLRKDSHWKNIFRYTLVAGILGVAMIIMVWIYQKDVNWFGLVERVLVANMIIWVEVTAIKLLLLSLKRGRPAVNKAD